MSQITSAQLSEWEAYDILDPIGTFRSDLMLAKVASLIQNIALAVYAKEGEEPKFTAPIDFIPIWDPEEVKRLEKEKVQKQTVEELKAGLLSFAKVHNLRIEKALNRKRNPPPKFRKHGS